MSQERPTRTLTSPNAPGVTVELYGDRLEVRGAVVVKPGGLLSLTLGDGLRTGYELVGHGGEKAEDAWSTWRPAPPAEAESLWIGLPSGRATFDLRAQG